MSNSRVEVALSSLVGEILPALPPDEEQNADQKHEEALLLAKSILQEYGNFSDAHDINQVADGIKKRFWRDHHAPDKAVQFANLFSRLLTLPILNRKKELIVLLDQIASPSDEDGTSGSQSPTRQESRTADNAERPPSGLQEASAMRLNQLPDRGFRGKVSEIAAANRAPPRGIAIQRDGPAGELNGPESPQAPESQAPSESVLLRDLPFTLQGLSSTSFVFQSKFEMSLPASLPLPIISLLHQLAEPSLLYRALSEWVQEKNEGLISQSLRAAIGMELRSYLGLIATLEGETRRTAISLEGNTQSKEAIKVGVTLKRCIVWTRDATMGLRLMSLLAEESKSKRGGQLITLIHTFVTSYGDPFVSAFAERLLGHLTKPFYTMLRQWIYDGELSDPYQEFFVIEQDPDNDTRDLDARRVPASSVWENKYKFDKSLVPSIINDDFANKVFLIGKSLNFIRYGCGDSAWVEAYSKDASKELKYGDTANLEASIDEAYKTTMARLIHLMDDKFKLFEHLNALKKYLLLGQGDFVALLMESLASNLDRPAGSQYRHTLTAQLDHAIRGSNAQYDSPDVLRRLDARLLELSHGDIGWDVFTLEYKVDAPVDVVITSWANKQYLVVFNFLWRIKRVEFALGITWRRLMTGARGILAGVSDKLGNDWKTARCCVAEMTHFINQLQYYILFEVIEASWDQLQIAIAKPDCTLDDLITAHTKYLNSITHKGLLGASRSSLTGSREDSFMSQLHYLLKVMLAYRDAVDGLYSFSVAEFFRAQEYATQVEARTARGQWGRSDADDIDDLNSPLMGDRYFGRKAGSRQGDRERDTDSPIPGAAALAGISAAAGAGANDDQMLSALQKRLTELCVEFRTRLATLLGDLLVQPDPDMKFLGVVMNFNDVYKPVRRKRRDHKEKESKEKEHKTKEREAKADAAKAPETAKKDAAKVVQEAQRKRATKS